MNITDTKSIEIGDTLYAIPTGNAARRWDFDKDGFKVFNVVNIKRKYVELKPEGWSSTHDYSLESGATRSSTSSGYGNDSGYKFFKSPEDYIEYKRVLEVRKGIFDSMCNYSLNSRVSNECALELYDVLVKHGVITKGE